MARSWRRPAILLFTDYGIEALRGAHLTDALFHSFDGALREMGVGDTGIPKRMRTIAAAFLGRARAYDLALNSGTPELATALARNVYDGRVNPDRLVRYVGPPAKPWPNVSLDAFAPGQVPFPRPSIIR